MGHTFAVVKGTTGATCDGILVLGATGGQGRMRKIRDLYRDAANA